MATGLVAFLGVGSCITSLLSGRLGGLLLLLAGRIRGITSSPGDLGAGGHVSGLNFSHLVEV